MKKLMFPIAVFATALLFTVSSCKDKTTETVKLAPDVAKTELSNSADDMAGMLTTFQDGEAMTAFDDFMAAAKKKLKIAAAEGETYWFDDMFLKLENHIDFDGLNNDLETDGRFYFSKYLGKYTWNFTSLDWDKTSSTSIIIEFPSKVSSTTNDAAFKFTSYSDVAVTIDGEPAYLPESLHASLELDGVKLIGADLNNASFSSGDFFYPTNIDAELFVSPITSTYIFDEKSSTEYYASVSVGDGQNTVGVESTLRTKRAFSEDFDETDLVSILGKIYFNTLEFRYSANIENILAFEEEPTEAQINAEISVEIYAANAYAAKLILENDEIWVVYSDGSKELAEDRFNSVIAEMEQIMEDNQSVVKIMQKKIDKNQFKKLKSIYTSKKQKAIAHR